MGKSKKNRQKDFQKVKLKVGKRLPKGQNVTNTSFKSHSVQIREQLKTSTDLPSTKRKLNINDLLGQLHHYNISVRHDALVGLRELTTEHPAILNTHLPDILEKTSTLFVDKDNVVRQAIMKLLKNIFPNVSTTQIQPFFPILVAHLCCAMTHIFDDVRADSLAILDITLDNFPELVTKNSGQLLQNFLDLISKSSNTSSSSSQTRTLSVNPNSKLSSQKWRIKVLERLHNFLSAVVRNASDGKVEISTSGATLTVNQDSDCPYIQLIGYDHVSHLHEGFKLRSQESTEASAATEHLSMFIENLLPLLTSSWMEVKPDDTTQGAALSEEAATLMLRILGVLHLLCQLVTSSSQDQVSLSWLCGLYMADFNQYFMAGFPYSIHTSVRKGKQQKQEVTSTQLNLALCYVMAQFLSVQNGKSLQSTAALSHTSAARKLKRAARKQKSAVTQLDCAAQLKNVNTFLVELVSHEKLSTPNLEDVLSIVHVLIKEENNIESAVNILDTLFDLFTRCHHLSGDRVLLLDILDTILLMDNHDLLGSDAVCQWIKILPSWLVAISNTNEETVCKIVRMLQTAASIQHFAFVSGIEEALLDILDAERGVFNKFSPSVQISILELFYRVPRFSRMCYGAILTMCHAKEHNLSLPVVQHLLNILARRCERLVSSDSVSRIEQLEETGAFVSFILSLMLAAPHEELGQDRGTIETGYKFTSDSALDYTRYLSLSKMSVSTLQELSQVIAGNTLAVTLKPLMAHTSLPLQTAMSLIYYSTIYRSTFDSSTTHQMATLCSSLLRHLLSIEETNVEKCNIWRDLYQDVLTMISTCDAIAVQVLTSLINIVKENISSDRDEMRTFCLVLKTFLRHSAMSPHIQPVVHQLQSLVEYVHNHTSDSNTLQDSWWTDLKYDISILK
ncbi:unnamed protein product [Owenia fusiformis]|uniref:Pre-rRNA-processing protein Ipi1 N-terminal domain-containing protein n=1 Tax=Owenia fusiformis TaxID=6347 RepID=A0A8J1XS73_OWEFU|nr:unnamed protein product [Owenia fusiformis]